MSLWEMLLPGSNSTTDRTFAVLGMVTLGVGSKIGKIFKVLKRIAKGEKSGEAIAAGEKVVEAVSKGEWSKIFSDKVRPSELLKNSSLEKKLRADKKIPGNWEVKMSKASKQEPGLIYHAPGNTHHNVRVMPGNPGSPHHVSKKPYVVVKKDGKTLDKFGNPSSDPNQTHVPLDEFKLRE